MQPHRPFREIAMFDTLMLKRRFAPLFWAQFFSAFNDNFLKNALVFIILYKLAGSHGEALVTLAGGLFIAPFFLLSGIGGQMADRFDKAVMAQRLKLAEIGAAAVAVLGFTLHSVPVLFVALGLFGVIAALFGPIKYGILPDHLKREELPAGNALIEGATFIAILLGTIAGGLTAREGGDAAQLSLLILVFALACWVATLFIPKTGPAAPDLVVDRNILRSTRDLLRDLWGDARLWRTGVMVSLFWLIGAVVMSLLPSLVKNGMGGTEMVVSTYLGIFAIAIAVGSGIGSFLSSGRIVLLPVPVAGVVMGLFALDLGWAVSGIVAHQPAQDIGAFFAGTSAWRVGIDLAGLAIAGGVFVVPSFAAAQAWAPAEKRARIVAAVNVLSAAFMVAGAVVVALLQAAGLTLSHLFLLIGVLTIAASVWILRTLPTNPLSDFLSILFRAFYRVEVSGRENIAKAGDNAIIALNHVSFLDAALALSILDKEPVFAIDHGIAQRWWVKPFLKLTRSHAARPGAAVGDALADQRR
jgi:acyl-[acyl-carrier-protein]-phospholipid O-acyltransferase/long-chain-fatty-acid--[acyl-carrier-protein] ligase